MFSKPLAATALALLLVLAGCDAAGGGTDATLSGQVVNAETNRAVSGATVQILSMRVEEVSDSTGAYSTALAVDSLVQVRVTAFKTGYAADTVTVSVEPGQAVTVPPLLLRLGAAGDGTSGPAASISLAPRSAQTVGVSGTGSTETATLTFIARDADGRPVDAAHAVSIAVALIQGPGGGEFLSPAAPQTVRTNADGEASVTLTSGTAAGVVQVETRATVEGRLIRSQPIMLVIHGGFPDQAHFSVGTARLNFPGLAISGVTNAVGAIVGDRYGNPVQRDTQVYFTTTGGVVGGSSPTDADGRAGVTLRAANPLPLQTGLATVTARTAGPDGVPVQATTTVLFSGLPRVRLLTPGLALGTYDYVVDDPLGNPLASGTSITVTVDGENVATQGRTTVALGDYLEPGAGRTSFQFRIVRAPGSVDPAVVTQIKIEVTGPNGNVEAYRPGGLRPGQGVVGRAPRAQS